MITPDIKCYGTGCALSDKCKRYAKLAIREYGPNTRFLNSPFYYEGKLFRCVDFIGGELDIVKYNMKKR